MNEKRAGSAGSAGYLRRAGIGLLIIVGVLGTCVAAVAIVAESGREPVGAGDVLVQSRNGAPSVRVSPSRALPGPQSRFGDGVWLVGQDVMPGRYRAVQPVGKYGQMCYWEISDPDTTEILANDLAVGGRPTVLITAGTQIKSQDCGEWRRMAGAAGTTGMTGAA